MRLNRFSKLKKNTYPFFSTFDYSQHIEEKKVHHCFFFRFFGHLRRKRFWILENLKFSNKPQLRWSCEHTNYATEFYFLTHSAMVGFSNINFLLPVIGVALIAGRRLPGSSHVCSSFWSDDDYISVLFFPTLVEEDFMLPVVVEPDEDEPEKEPEQIKQERRLLSLDIIRFLGNAITKLCRDVDNRSESIKLSNRD